MRNFYSLVMVLVAFILCSCSGLLYNAKTGNIERMEASLEHGTAIETKNEAGSTALIVAAYNKQSKAVEYLCKKGANVNAQDNYRRTALIHAAYYNIYYVAEILVKYGADKTIKDRYGNTALDYAKQYEYTQMITLLETVMPTTPTTAPVSGLAEGSAQKTAIKFNPEEPWTGTWEVESSGGVAEGQWVLKQQGNRVKSVGDSSFNNLRAEVKGNELKGSITNRRTEICPIKIKISADGQSFEGTLAGYRGNIVGWIKGKREK